MVRRFGRSRLRLSLGTLPLLGGGVAIVIGGVVFVAWIFGLEGVKRLYPGLPQMKANTALALIALGAAVVLLRPGLGRARWSVGRVIALSVAAFGVVVLGEYLLGGVGVDELLFNDAGPTPGRPAPHTAVAFVTLGAALAAPIRTDGRRLASDWLLGAAAVVVLSALVGYVYDVDFLRATSGTTGIALPTALGLAALVGGAAFLRPDGGLIGYLRQRDLGATMARRLLPAVILLPLVLGLVRLQSERLGLDSKVGVGLNALVTMGVLLTLVLVVSERLSVADERRVAADAATALALVRARSLLEATPDPIVVVDDAGRIARVNSRTRETLGFAASELVGEPVETLLPGGLSALQVEHRSPAVDASGPSEMRGTGPVARRKDGSELPVEITLSPLEADDGTLVIAAIRDVSERRRAEASLRKAARFFDVTDYLLCTASFDGRFLEVNGSWHKLLGWTPEQLRAGPFLDFVHPNDREPTRREFEHVVGGGSSAGFRNRYRHLDGGWRWLEWNVTGLADEQLVFAAGRDVTDRVQAEDARREAEQRFIQAFEEAPIGMGITSLHGNFLHVNDSLCALTGYSAEQLEATDFQSITHPDDVQQEIEARLHLIAGQTGRHRAETRFINADGEAVAVDISLILARNADGEPSHFVSQVVDMSERKRFEADLQHLADHDPLTGLFNRRRFESELRHELAMAERYGNRGALLALDLDNFKYINDSLGHAAGDELLTRVATGLKQRLRETDVLARVGGDEFAIVLPQAAAGEALLVAEKLIAAVREHGDAEGGRQVSASVGVAMFEDAANLNADELMADADCAMYDAKQSGRNRVATFDVAGGSRRRIRAGVTWADRIHDALTNGHFVLHAQSILGLGGDHTPRYELLIRMLGHDGDPIPPNTFLGIAERFDLVRRIDRWVVGEAIRLLAEQQAAGHDVRLQVNVSAKSVTDSELFGFVARQFAATGADPRRLCFEITETAAIVNIDSAKRFARNLKGLGCEFALDDFGAGFATFYYLTHLEFDYLKIDGEFIRDLPNNPTNQLVVKALVQITRGLGKRTIAEYVTDAETLALIQDYGVDYAQGFHIARPEAIRVDHPASPARFPLVRQAA